jgi:hypothetical protein
MKAARLEFPHNVPANKGMRRNKRQARIQSEFKRLRTTYHLNEVVQTAAHIIRIIHIIWEDIF